MQSTHPGGPFPKPPPTWNPGHWSTRLVMIPVSLLLLITSLFISMFFSYFMPEFLSELVRACSQFNRSCSSTATKVTQDSLIPQQPTCAAETLDPPSAAPQDSSDASHKNLNCRDSGIFMSSASSPVVDSVDYTPPPKLMLSEARGSMVTLETPVPIFNTCNKTALCEHLKTLILCTNVPWFGTQFAILDVLTPRARRPLYLAQDMLAFIEGSQATVCLLVTTQAEAVRQSELIFKYQRAIVPHLNVLDLVHVGVVPDKNEAVLAFPVCQMGSVADRIRVRKLAPCEALAILTLAVRAMARARIAGLEFVQFKLDYVLIRDMVSTESDLSVDNVLIAGYQSLFELDHARELAILNPNVLTCSELVVLSELVSKVTLALDPKRVLESDLVSSPLYEMIFFSSPSLNWSQLLDCCAPV